MRVYNDVPHEFSFSLSREGIVNAFAVDAPLKVCEVPFFEILMCSPGQAYHGMRRLKDE